MTRRKCLRRLALAAAAGAEPAWFGFRAAAASPFAAAESRPTGAESAALAKTARAFMERYEIPGLSVAIARHGQFVYEQAFGFADKEKKEAAAPRHRFRIASVTKPITSVAIFGLIEKRRLKLEDRLFGEGSLFGADYGTNLDERVRELTVHHLLTHTAGGWPNDGQDPMFRHREMGHPELISWALANRPLTQKPGTHQAYSNFGYCILGRVVEKVSGQSYEDYVRREVLARCGVTRMQIAGNTRGERAADEVVYDDPVAYALDVRRMDSHGGWIATARDLVNFATHVDGFATTPSLLRPDTIKTMTTAPSVGPHYACGWCVNAARNWWHDGSLPGTASLMVRTATGLCWAALTNRRAAGVDLALDQMMWKLAGGVPAWKA